VAIRSLFFANISMSSGYWLRSCLLPPADGPHRNTTLNLCNKASKTSPANSFLAVPPVNCYKNLCCVKWIPYIVRCIMAVQDFQAFFLPMLEFAADGKVHSLQETYAALADHFVLTDADRKEMLPSVTQVIYKNRIAWARTYLAKAMLLESPVTTDKQLTHPPPIN